MLRILGKNTLDANYVFFFLADQGVWIVRP